MARYGKGGLSTSIGNLGIDKPKQSLIRASEGFEGGMEGLVERAKEHGVGQWGHEAFGDDYYTDLKSDRGVTAYLAKQAQEGNWDPRVWQVAKDDTESDTSDSVPEAKVEPIELDQGMIDSANERIDNRSEAKSRAQSYKETEAMDDANIENAALQTAGEPNNLSDDDQLNVYDNPFDTQRKQSSIASMITGKHAGLG